MRNNIHQDIKKKLVRFFGRVENRDTFFRRVHRFVLPYHEDAILIANAYNFVKKEFDGKKRKRGERYFEHCRFVALILMELLGVTDPEEVAAALQHDSVEDIAGVTVEHVASRSTMHTAGLVSAVTMPKGEFKDRDERIHAFHAQINAGPRGAWRIKLADRLHNLWTAHSLSFDAQLRMIEETEKMYLPIAKARGWLYEELLCVIAMRKNGLAKFRGEKLPSRN